LTVIVNSSPKISYKVFVRGHGLNMVTFETLRLPWWYRIFRKSNGRLVALEEMETGHKRGWTFVASILIPDELPIGP
jgi:hypothetical protein